MDDFYKNYCIIQFLGLILQRNFEKGCIFSLQ